MKMRARTYVHDEVPDENDPPADGAVDVPEPKAEEDGVVGLIAELGPQQEEVVPKPVPDPVINPVLILGRCIASSGRVVVLGRLLVGQTRLGIRSPDPNFGLGRDFDRTKRLAPVLFNYLQFFDAKPTLKIPDQI